MQFFRMYIGGYVVPFADAIVSGHPNAFMAGSRVHMSQECSSLAVSYATASFPTIPPGAPTAWYEFEASTLWYSKQSQVRALYGSASKAKCAAGCAARKGSCRGAHASHGMGRMDASVSDLACCHRLQAVFWGHQSVTMRPRVA
jgi:hypothetical protein